MAACIMCFETYPPPIQSGCACRGDAGLAHVGCLIETAVSQIAHRGNAVWWECQTCKRYFTGQMRTGLAGAWWLRVHDQVEESDERLSAAANLASSLSEQGKHGEAEQLNRELLAVRRRVLGVEHPCTLAAANNLASTIWRQGRWAEAEQLEREVLAVQTRVLGTEHPDTLMSAGNLAASLSDRGKWAEAEKLNCELFAVRRRLFGAEHPDTLMTAGNLAAALSRQGKSAEAELLNREVLSVRRRVLGGEHPDTLTSAHNLAASLSSQGKWAEAEAMLQATLITSQRVLGTTHPVTLTAAQSLANVQARMHAEQPTEKGGCFSCCAPRQLGYSQAQWQLPRTPAEECAGSTRRAPAGSRRATGSSPVLCHWRSLRLLSTLREPQ